MNNPKVTIITATYNLIKNNRKDYFIQALESVHNQSYENIEHLIIDGASNDGTVELLEEYSKKGWIKYISEPDKGIYDAFNKGIMKATGKYIAFLNSDDYYNNINAVKLSVKKLEKTKSAFSFAVATVIKEDGSIYSVFKPMPKTVWSKHPFCHQTMFTLTDVLKKEGMFNLKYKSAADYDFIIRLFIKDYKWCEMKQNIVTFRLGSESNINRKQSILDCLNIYKDTYTKYMSISDLQCKDIIMLNVIPFKLLYALGVKNPLIYLRYF